MSLFIRHINVALQTIGVSIYKGITLLQVDPIVLMNYSVFNHDLRRFDWGLNRTMIGLKEWRYHKPIHVPESLNRTMIGLKENTYPSI